MKALLKNPKILIFSIVALLFLFASQVLAQEQLTITTYFPSPTGSYRELEWGDLPNRSRGHLTPDQGSSIELGGLNSSGGVSTPYIDFHNDMTMTNDFDMRLELRGDDQLWVRGGQTFFANDALSGTSAPAVIRVKEVWYCASY